MEATAGGQSMTLSDLVRAEEQGLDLNRLLFVKYLLLTKRLTDEVAGPQADFELPAAA